MIKKIANSPISPLFILDNLGETAIAVATSIFKNFIEFLALILKLIWEKTIKIRTKLANIAKYLFVFIASPFVKMWVGLHNMNRDMKEQKKEKGSIGVALAFFPYLAKFLFGRRGLMVTAFNYAAPILSIVFLLNVVAYATSTNFTLRLTVNGEFLGYIENEQVFLDAEALMLQRVNYFGSDQNIELQPEFAIANVGSNETLTMNQVFNSILLRSDFTLARAHGFFVDGNLYGAVLDEDIHLIRETIDSLLGEFATGEPDEEIDFLNHVVWEGYDLFLEESVVDPQEIITMITATDSDGNPHLPVTVTRTETYNSYNAYMTVFRDDDTLFVGSTSVEQQGVRGVNRLVARVTYVNDEEVRRNVIQTTLISEPTTQIIHRGTRPHTTGTVSEQRAQYGMFIWPTVTASGQPVGHISPGRHFRPGHRGIDITGSGFMGTPIVAAGNGTVVLSQHNYWGYGHTIIIQHDNGLRTLYAHNSLLLVGVGDEVTQGQQIATAGSTGDSTGPHLHFEVRDGNRLLDPMQFLPRG